MCGNDLDLLHVVGIEQHDMATHGLGDALVAWRDVVRQGTLQELLLAHGVCDVVVLDIGREGADGYNVGGVLAGRRGEEGAQEESVQAAERVGYTVWVGGSDDLMEALHVCNVVDKDEILHDDQQASPVQSQSTDPGGEGEFAYGGLPLCVDDAEKAGREDESDERSGEEHLEDGDVTRRAILGERGLV